MGATLRPYFWQGRKELGIKKAFLTPIYGSVERLNISKPLNYTHTLSLPPTCCSRSRIIIMLVIFNANALIFFYFYTLYIYRWQR